MRNTENLLQIVESSETRGQVEKTESVLQPAKERCECLFCYPVVIDPFKQSFKQKSSSKRFSKWIKWGREENYANYFRQNRTIPPPSKRLPRNSKNGNVLRKHFFYKKRLPPLSQRTKIKSLQIFVWMFSRGHNLCRDNRQLIVIAINRNRSASKNNRN